MTAPRTILYTGKGGVGKTSVAAATARRCAAAGLRTIVLSTDPAHSLSDSLEAELGADPTPAGDRLWGQEVQAQDEMERHWDAVQSWLGELLADRGVDAISAEELTVPPGMDELFSLLQIKRHHEPASYDASSSTAPRPARRCDCSRSRTSRAGGSRRCFPWEQRLVGAARPIARTILDVPLPSEAVFDDVQRLVRNLVAMNAILRDREHASIRLVMNPDRMVDQGGDAHVHLPEPLRLPDRRRGRQPRLPRRASTAATSGRGASASASSSGAVREGFSPVPVLTARYFEQEVIGPEMLDRLGDELFADAAPQDVLHSELAQELSIEDGRTVLRLPIPFSDKAEIDLRRSATS